eukprot:s2586_g14.t1
MKDGALGIVNRRKMRKTNVDDVDWLQLMISEFPRHDAGNTTGGHPGVLRSTAEEAQSGVLYQLRKDDASEILRAKLYRGNVQIKVKDIDICSFFMFLHFCQAT